MVKFIRLLFLGFFIGTSSLIAANDFTLDSGSLIDKRTVIKINEIGNELKSKTQISIYVHVKNNFGMKTNITTKEKIAFIKEYEQRLVQNLEKPYVVLTFSLDQTHVNLLRSKDLLKALDKDDILDSYVIPLLASKDKNSTLAKVSAAVLNGYDEIAAQIVSFKGIEKLDSALGDSGRTFSAIWRVLMYSLVLFGIIAYTIIVLRSKKK
ncbi:MAG: hypothetical protein HRT41_05970 [Campylobacteraceae bacterium]|nr:hypothetical protein [Campylobacteraceae bacterium]